MTLILIRDATFVCFAKRLNDNLFSQTFKRSLNENGGRVRYTSRCKIKQEQVNENRTCNSNTDVFRSVEVGDWWAPEIDVQFLPVITIRQYR